jgi:uncharacterized protein (TIGR00255 family)
MTGFARVRGESAAGQRFTLTLKSINHRFLDLSMRLPGGCDALEMQLRKLLKEQLKRGHVDVTLQLEREESKALQLNGTLVAAYADAARRAAAEFGLAGEPDVNTVLRLPGVLNGEGNGELDEEALTAAAMAQAESAIAQLNQMRAAEGAALVLELKASLGRIAEAVDEVAGLRGEVRLSYFERMRQRITELLGASGAPQVAEQRILEEAAMLAERSDVEEELVRLRTHVQHFESLLDAGGELGKKLDFLLQELNREANTLLSKTSGAAAGNGLRITELGLHIKSEIEKVREQVQNLE